jgi:hypothetical protein
MKTFALMTAGLTLALAAGVAQAKGPKGGGMSGGGKPTMSAPRTTHSMGNVNKGNSSYHLQHGTKFSQGYFFKGKQHTHWTSRSFDKRYGCWTYYCPSTCCSYYWCEPACCYYPVTYCPYKTYCWPACYTCVEVPVVTVTPVVTYQPVVTYKPVVSYQSSVSYRTVKTYTPAVVAGPVAAGEPVGAGPVGGQRAEVPPPPAGPGVPG